MSSNHESVSQTTPDARLPYLQFMEKTTDGREEVEKFIHDVFVRAYVANVKNFLPRLLVLRNHKSRILAALGMQNAADEKLFLEQYLDDPVEDIISHLSGNTISREYIIEVGNLASIHRGSLRHLIVAMTSFLSGIGTEWVVFTAVPAVSKAFAAIGLNLIPLAVADKTRLDNDQEQWGSYYETGPVVVATRVKDAFMRLREAVHQESLFRDSLHLWEQAYAGGFRLRKTPAQYLPLLAIGGGAS